MVFGLSTEDLETQLDFEENVLSVSYPLLTIEGDVPRDFIRRRRDTPPTYLNRSRRDGCNPLRVRSSLSRISSSPSTRSWSSRSFVGSERPP